MRNAAFGRRGAQAWFAAAIGAAFMAAPAADAGTIFFPGRLEDKKPGAFAPDPEANGGAFSVRHAAIDVSIEDGAARVRIAETLEGHAGKAKDLLGLVPLPDGATNAKAVATPAAAGLKTEVLTRQQAQPLYEEVARGAGATGVLAFSGKPAIRILAPAGWLDRKVEMAVEYEQPVPEKDGLFAFSAFLPAAAFSREPAGRTTVSATIKSKRPLRAILSPTHEIDVERTGLHEARVRAIVEGSAGGEFRLVWAADADPLGLRVLAHRAKGEDKGYFLLLGNPTGSDTPEPEAPKDVLFALDTSGSMRGEKMDQALAAIEECLGKLGKGDRFNLVTFGTDARSFREDVVPATKENVSAARAYAEDIVATGRTNIDGALAKALAGKADPSRPRFLFFLTDGSPTAGELKPAKILEKALAANAAKARVFVFGVGNDVNVHLLDNLAEATDGAAEYVAAEEAIDVKVAALYNRLSRPFLQDVRISFGELMTSEAYPKKAPSLYLGSELLIAGRYRDGGRHKVTVSGTRYGKPVEYSREVDFPKAEAAENEFVATLWAARTIGFLLQEIRLKGENKELVESVVELSRKYGVVTEYTAFLADDDGKRPAGDIASEASARMKKANAEQAGAWAVRQARNEKELQGRTVASPAASTFTDRSGRVQAVENVRQVGRRVFYQRNGQWEDAEEAGARKSRTVEAFSPEYFDLVRNHPDFAKAQEIGRNVTLNVGDERITVK